MLPSCGVRRKGKRRRYGGKAISIHAPRVGCDDIPARQSIPYPNFNPRTPCGVRQQRHTKFVICTEYLCTKNKETHNACEEKRLKRASCLLIFVREPTGRCLRACGSHLYQQYAFRFVAVFHPKVFHLGLVMVSQIIKTQTVFTLVN